MTTIITDVGGTLTWEEARDYSLQYGGVLTSRLYHSYGGGGAGREHKFEEYAWIGAHKEGDEWVWMDGSPVEQTDGSYQSGYVDEIFLDGDPSNDPDYAVLSGSSLRKVNEFFEFEFLTKFIWEKEGATIAGTPFADWIWGGIVGKTVSLGAGDDWVFDNSDHEGSKVVVNAGSGNDQVTVVGATHATVTDGAGTDNILIATGVIKASLDGENDDLYADFQSTLTYETAKQDLIMLGDGKIRSAEIGIDTVQGFQLIGGSGDDVLRDFQRITGGKGDDTITPHTYGTGGDGNDTLIAAPNSKVTLLGDAGADTFIVRGGYAPYGPHELTGGAGIDRFVFEVAAAAKINDLKAGEKIDLSALLDVSVPDAFAGGYLKQTVLKGYTYLSIDLDGGGNDYQDLATLKGVFNLADYLLV